MKREVISLILVLVMSTLAIGQETIQIKEVNVSPPKFKGVMNVTSIYQTEPVETIEDYLARNFNYDYSTTEYIVEGVEVVSFVINADGKLSDFKIVNGLSPDVNEEIVRVLKTTNGMWLPGIRDEKLVAMEEEVSLALYGDSRKGIDLQKEFVEKSRKHFEHAGEQFLVERHPRRALNSYNRSGNYTPNDKAMLLMRGLCKYELNDKKGAREDWQRLVDLGGVNIIDEYLSENIQDKKGYEELLTYLNE